MTDHDQMIYPMPVRITMIRPKRLMDTGSNIETRLAQRIPRPELPVMVAAALEMRVLIRVTLRALLVVKTVEESELLLDEQHMLPAIQKPVAQHRFNSVTGLAGPTIR